MHRLNTPVLIVFAAVALVGCAQWATYPPIETATGFSSPIREPIPTLIAMSVEHVNTEHGGARDAFAVNLPTGYQSMAVAAL